MAFSAVSRALLHPLAAGSLRNWIGARRSYGGVDLAFRPMAAVITTVSCWTVLLRVLERAVWTKRVEAVSIDPRPVFILGHWRSGTTFLHNLMARDPALGFVTSLQAFYPELCAGGTALLPLIRGRIGAQKRPGDNVRVSLDDPQEEEFGISGRCLHSFYYGISFPRSSRELFRRWVLFEDVPPRQREEWEAAYLKVLKTAVFLSGRPRLVLKNPCNTARIPELLKLFPQAKFVHICRDPIQVYFSTRHFFQTLADGFCLQHVTRDQLEEDVLTYYEWMMRRYWETVGQIPAGNLVEVRYEDLVRDPLATVESLYGALDISGFETARPRFQEYIASQRLYERNRYELDCDTQERVARRWGFALDRLGYAPPEARAPVGEGRAGTGGAAP